MNVVSIHSERIEVWAGAIAGTDGTCWFVEYCSVDGAIIVDDCDTQEAAVAEARSWALPVVLIRERGEPCG
jgi:hypothetical protein